MTGKFDTEVFSTEYSPALEQVTTAVPFLMVVVVNRALVTSVNGAGAGLGIIISD
jgi:hypothetical protein